MPVIVPPAPVWRDRLWLAAVMLLAAALYIPTLGLKPLWNDEAFSYFAAYQGPGPALEFISSDTHPPLYYLVLSLWLRVGNGPFALRLLSAIAMVGSVPPLYDAARRLCGRPVACLAILLFVLDPNTANWAQKARPYGLQTLLVAIAFWGFVRVYTDPAALSTRVFTGLGRAETRGIDLGWLAYALGGALAMLTQQPAGFFLLACNILVALRLIHPTAMARPQRITLFINWCMAQFLLIAVWLIWLPGFLGQISVNLTPATIAARHTNFLIGWPDILGTLAGLFGTSSLWSLQPAMLALCGALVAVALARRWEPVAPGTIALPILVGLCGFVFVHPVFGYVLITFVWLMLPYAILLAAGVLALPSRLLRAAAGAALLALTGLGLFNYARAPNPPLDEVTAAIAADLHPGDAVVLSRTGAGRWALAYYLGPPYAGRLAGLDIARQWDDGAFIRTPAEAANHPRVWFLIPDGETLLFPPEALAPAMARALDQRFGRIQLVRMDAIR